LNTGRLASANPNLQQLPRDGKYRGAFIPKPGYCFIDCDFPGQELAIAAAASGEKKWIDIILAGGDIHAQTAFTIFPVEMEDPKMHSYYRQIGKTLNFTILYGGGPYNISLKTGIQKSTAIRAVYKFKKSVPQLIKWLAANAKDAVATRTSYSADAYKRRRTMRDPEDWMLENIGKNNPIQAGGANMIKRAMVNAYERGVPLVLQVHDQLIAEVPIKESAKWSKILSECMNEAADYCTGIPGLIKVKPAIVYNLLKH
jgi:DNA polymerase-1